jgi:methylmalonyl-CoA mutase N-terminal domain/subunit
VSELERMRTDRKNVIEWLERAKAERDEQRRIKIVYQDRAMRAEARLDKALAALREVCEAWYSPGGRGLLKASMARARAAIAEIEGEA